MTVAQNEARFSPREIKGARGVRELMRIRGVTSNAEIIRMIKSGGILNCPYPLMYRGLPGQASIDLGLPGQASLFSKNQ